MTSLLTFEEGEKCYSSSVGGTSCFYWDIETNSIALNFKEKGPLRGAVVGASRPCTRGCSPPAAAQV